MLHRAEEVVCPEILTKIVKIVKSDYWFRQNVFSSVRIKQHGSTQGIFMKFDDFSKICRYDSSFINI
jgi:hypothetical protein